MNRKRLRKRPRLHLLDTGLVCYQLDIQGAEMLARHPLRGAIFESFVAQRRQAPLYSRRDATGHEIDILIDLFSGKGDQAIPIEVK